MRLNAKTFPVLDTLDKGDYLNLELDNAFSNPDPKIGITIDLIQYMVNSVKELHRQVAHRYYVTKPFSDAIEKAAPKILYEVNYFTNEKSDCGIIFHQNKFTMYLTNPKDKIVKALFFGFNKHSLTSFCILQNDGKYMGRYYRSENGKDVHDEEMLVGWTLGQLVTLYFIHNCEIETKVLAPNEKHRQDGVRFFNESKNPFTILSCHWFTELIRTTPFNVKGFLRWQACGKEWRQRKLIWVEGFEKKGYHRKAQKTINQNIS